MEDDTDRAPSPERLFDEMEVLEPYTTGELASAFEAPKSRIREVLDRLAASKKIRKKEPEPKRAIWIREAPIIDCSECGFKYEVKFLHPVFTSVQYCPQCGNQL